MKNVKQILLGLAVGAMLILAASCATDKASCGCKADENSKVLYDTAKSEPEAKPATNEQHTEQQQEEQKTTKQETISGTECTNDADCVPATCCHPTSCVPASAAPECKKVMCTAVCLGPIDCGRGSCVCQNGKCAVNSKYEPKAPPELDRLKPQPKSPKQ